MITHFINSMFRLGYRLVYAMYRRFCFIYKSSSIGTQMAVWAEGRLLVIKNSYRPGLHMPGGHASSDLSFMENALKELWEETGVKLSPENVSFARTVRHRRHGVLVTDFIYRAELTRMPVVTLDQREVIFGVFLLPEEIEKSEHELDICLVRELEGSVL